MTPRATWLLPVRDGMPYLRECLASLEAQTLRDSEVLAWDNGSRDGSADELRRWIPARLPGRVVAARPFANLGACLRAMVAEARGELVARIDADDVCEPRRLERQVAALDRERDWLGVGSWLTKIDSAGGAGELESWYPSDPRALRWEVFFRNPLPHPSACLRREAVLRAGSYAELEMGQDWDLWLRMVLLGPLGNVAEPLLRYRLHAQSVSARRQDAWPRLGRSLAERYAPSLFPSVPLADAMAVWRFLSPRSPERGRPPVPPPRLVHALAVAGARAAGWDRHALARLPRVRAQMRACVKRRPAWLPDWLAVELRLGARALLRGRPRASRSSALRVAP